MGEITKRQKWMAQRCVKCKLCKYARKKQKGLIFNMVRLESRICPFCRAYERIYGRRSYEPYEV
jgi:hypothetical protein